MKRQLMIIACIFFMLATKAYADVEVLASVDRTQVSLGESLQLQISIKGQKGDVNIKPVQKNFRVMSQSSSSSINMINGDFSRSVTYSYIIKPLREGALDIPPLAVISEGKTYWTQKISVQVSKRPQQNTGQNTQDVFMRAFVSNPNPYESQQIIYTFQLYNSVQIKNARFSQNPNFSGFTAKQIEKQKEFNAVVSGKKYHVIELNYILIPVSSGEKIISPAEITCDVVHRSNRRRRSFFDDFDPFFGGGSLEPRTLTSKPISVKVKALPPYSGDKNFSGLVGDFDIIAQLETANIKTGDSVTLSLTIKGRGNIIDAQKPQIAIPEGFKAYEDAPQENIRLDRNGYSGQKIFRIALVPFKPGKYTLPSIDLPYFDSIRGEYITARSAPLTLNVLPSQQKDQLEVFSAPDTNPLKPLKKKVEFTGRDILPVKESLDALKSHNSLSFMGFMVFLISPAILCLSISMGRNFTKKSSDPGTIMTNRSEKALKQAIKAGQDRELLLSSLYRALICAILAKANILGESLTYTEAQNILESKGYNAEIAALAARVLEKIESAKFGGLLSDENFYDDLLKETQALLEKLSK